MNVRFERRAVIRCVAKECLSLLQYSTARDYLSDCAGDRQNPLSCGSTLYYQKRTPERSSRTLSGVLSPIYAYPQGNRGTRILRRFRKSNVARRGRQRKTIRSYCRHLMPVAQDTLPSAVWRSLKPLGTMYQPHNCTRSLMFSLFWQKRFTPAVQPGMAWYGTTIAHRLKVSISRWIAGALPKNMSFRLLDR